MWEQVRYCVTCHQMCQGLWIEKAGEGGESIKNTIAMLPSGLTQMWHGEELDFCSFMFPWPFERGRKKADPASAPSYNAESPEQIQYTGSWGVRAEFHVVRWKTRERVSWGVKITEQKVDELNAKPLSQVSVIIGGSFGECNYSCALLWWDFWLDISAA